ncbi:MAG: ABC transporter permease [Chitinophagaceae bacterium]
MIKNYFKYSWRSLIKNRTYSLLNIAGLTAGITCFALIALWVNDEMSYDKFNKNYNQITRLTGISKTETGIIESAVSSAPMAKALKNDYPEIENTVRLRMREDIITHKNQQTLQPGILVADPSLFEVFSYHLTKGNVTTALTEPYSIILTETTAKKYFGESDPMGQTLSINMYDSTGYGANYKVTGVMPDPPANAHFTFNIIASFKTAEIADPSILTVDGWGDASFYTYLLLRNGVDVKKFSAKIEKFYTKYVGDRAAEWNKIYSYQLQPLADIHLRSHLQYEMMANGSSGNVYIFLTIGIFILLLAAINYVNLATAHSVTKAKETGIKKVIGALRNQLIVQYLSEAILFTITALLFSLLLCSLLSPAFAELTGKDLSIFASPLLLLFLLIVALVLGVIAGIYPAFVISSFRPIVVLKGSFKTSNKGILLRKTLVISQFIITILLVSSIIIIYSQVSYIKNKDLGYNKEALLFLRIHGNTDVIKGYSAFKNELLTNPLISGATVSNSMLGSLGSGGSGTVDDKGNKLQVNTARLRVDSAYLDVYGIKLLTGNNFKKGLLPDTVLPILLNETAVKKFGWKNSYAAIGKPFTIGDQHGSVIGVVKDFHFSPLQLSIGPLAIYPSAERFSRITLKTNSVNPAQVTAWVEKIWKKHFPSALLDYNFLDNALSEQYQSEDRFARIFLYFSILSLVIACLGLYGLISYTTTQKTKEIGIRKVLGASAGSIAMILSKDFLRLVIISFIIAVPFVLYLMNKWLQDFAYRINIAWWMFAVAGLTVVLIALLTAALKVIKAAMMNPVKSLRTE